ncbi:hypothetical protein TNCV_1271211 [Trichonephila clavipes]|nr:hypothetical protein TNCV_1271211 [Trichonephila clavipes]
MYIPYQTLFILAGTLNIIISEGLVSFTGNVKPLRAISVNFTLQSNTKTANHGPRYFEHGRVTRMTPEPRVVFNLSSSLGTSSCCAPHTLFPEHPPPSVLTLPVIVQDDFNLTLLLFSPSLFLLFEESFHYPQPMDLPCPRLAAVRKE